MERQAVIPFFQQSLLMVVAGAELLILEQKVHVPE
jgi:hypothetical protein